MKKPGASQGQSASELISKRIAELGDWRGETLSRMRKLIKDTDPDVNESAFKALVRQAVALNSSGKSKPSKSAKRRRR